MFDLWFRQPRTYMSHALEGGATKFTWHLASALSRKIDVLSWFRNAVVGHGECRMMIVDYTGASEYTQYDDYKAPLAVYPTWSADEPFEQLIHLVENPVSENPDFTEDTKIAPDMRPVKGQKHRVVLHQLGKDPERTALLLRIRDLQQLHPECEIFISQQVIFSTLFGFGFQAGDCLPGSVLESGSMIERLILPTGKALVDPNIWDHRYSDWFALLGWRQSNVTDRHQITRFNIESLFWAARNFDKAIPFVVERSGGTSGKRIVFRPSQFRVVSDKNFILPPARRNLMRNLGIDEELDKLACDTCMLHNACTLYREGSVCTVKGSEGVELSKHFGTRNAQAIITGLDHLLKKQVERLEQAQQDEETSGETDPDLTRQYNSVFANATKLAKLIDPALAGGPKVQVNVGVNGNAAVAVAAADPKQLVASVVAELEASGIPRNQITPEMVKGVLTGMANRGERALEAAKAAAPPAPEETKGLQSGLVIPGSLA